MDLLKYLTEKDLFKLQIKVSNLNEKKKRFLQHLLSSFIILSSILITKFNFNKAEKYLKILQYVQEANLQLVVATKIRIGPERPKTRKARSRMAHFE